MKGTILHFSIQTNTGIISGDDQNRYTFLGSEWKDSSSPQRGMKVDFDLNATGQAVGVYKALGSSTNIGVADLVNTDQSEEKYSGFHWFVKCLKNYVNFNGRARRKEFWFFNLVYFGLLLIISGLFGSQSPLLILLLLSMFLPALAVSTRRLHDIGKSGWWYLISFTGIGYFLLIFWWATEGDNHSNQYGEPTK
ncbi:DUF805 domain-containing protein [Acinetobacter sp. VNK23]|uniref:DUF805 domain-containing protein n=1 Tax=Acinetobacter thutiue TaxID=2998078 RepID=UPI002575CD11|nr:DUF805 domain-containing protein [Acinetobacter thutiue]MDM1020056.1 DUF805 domain-containing protein [Acinetobacter thutiue]